MCRGEADVLNLSDGGHLEGSSYTWSSSARHKSLPWICPLPPWAWHVSFLQMQNTPNAPNTKYTKFFGCSLSPWAQLIESFCVKNIIVPNCPGLTSLFESLFDHGNGEHSQGQGHGQGYGLGYGHVHSLVNGWS